MHHSYINSAAPQACATGFYFFSPKRMIFPKSTAWQGLHSLRDALIFAPAARQTHQGKRAEDNRHDIPGTGL
jgi:hypothetical protein